MAEYIEREAALNDLRDSYKKLSKIYKGLKDEREKEVCEGELVTFCEIILRLKAYPAADVVPVVHGRWEQMKAFRSQYVCSECGDLFPDFRSNYCPGCGARMDGE